MRRQGKRPMSSRETERQRSQGGYTIVLLLLFVVVAPVLVLPIAPLRGKRRFYFLTGRTAAVDFALHRTPGR